jgi:hypothetical protein
VEIGRNGHGILGVNPSIFWNQKKEPWSLVGRLWGGQRDPPITGPECYDSLARDPTYYWLIIGHVFALMLQYFSSRADILVPTHGIGNLG